MPNLELHYFRKKGRAEAIRLTLHIGGVPFENLYFDGFQDFADKQAEDKFLYGQVPVLHVDGEQYAQTSAMVRYCAKLAGLLPSSDMTAFAADEYMCALDEMFAKFPSGMPDDELRLAREKFFKIDVPRILGGVERAVLKRKVDDSPWLVGSELSYVDLFMYAMLGAIKFTTFNHVPDGVIEEYPRLMRMWQAVDEHPKVAEWMKEHPWKA